MSNPALAETQLLELLVQLKKTTPDAAKAILNSQPAIAYALITMMVGMNAVNTEVFQKTLAAFGASQAHAQASSAPASTPAPVAAAVNAPTAPAAYHHQQPPTQPQVYAQQHQQYPQQQQPHQQAPYSRPTTAAAADSMYPNGYSAAGYASTPVPPPTAPPASAVPSYNADALAAIPDDQKAMIMRLLSMTPEQINQLPPADRASIIQLRATFGVPT